MSESMEPGSPADSSACETKTNFGILKDGTRFPAPDTMSVMTALITPKSWKSPTTIIWILSWIAVGLSGVLFFTGVLPKWFFCLQFAFWRLAYNIGIGFMLYTQSNGGHFLKFYQHLMKTYPKMKGFLEASIVFKDNTEYKVDNFPDEFNAWMLFRQFENVILANDLVAYEVLFLVCLHPLRVDSFLDIIYILIGAGSVAFALWSKSDAHRVIGDFAWYWGDFFFLLDKNLTFDGIFQMFPHPMYTVGYAFMYGLPIMARSYTLFYMSVFGHLCQIAFLAFVENPHIDRTYGQCEEIGEEEKQRKEILYGDGQTEEYLEERESVVLMHFDGFRTSDLLLGLSVLYLLLSLAFPIPAWIYVVHGLVWRVVIHTGCIGYVLRMESSEKWFSKHYATPTKAFINWKRIYNASVTITNLSFVLCALKLCTWDSIIGEGLNVRILLSVVGGLLIGINAYVSTSIYHTVGVYGYYYGDFFISNVVPKLVYNGIYRYTNNPDSLFGVCAYYGIALISGSKVVLCMAVMTHLCTKAFEVLVEKPHMKKIYGSQLRKAGGLRTELHRRIKQVEENVRKLKSPNGKDFLAEACVNVAKSEKKNN